MAKTLRRYVRYIQGMSLMETLFASAVLSVVVVSGLTVMSDAIESKSKGDTRVAMLTEGVSTIEKARHEKDDTPDERTLLRQRLKEGDNYRTLTAKVDTSSKEVTAATTYDSAGDNQKLLLRSAFGGKNEALSTFFSASFQCVPITHTVTASSGSSGKSKKSNKKSKRSKKSKSVSPSTWDAHVAVTVYDYPDDNRDAFTVNVSDCTPASEDFNESGEGSRVFTCSRENISTSSWQPTITVNGFFSNANHQPGICIAEDQSDQSSWVTTGCTLNSTTNAASISLILHNNETACSSGDVPSNVAFPSTGSECSGSSCSGKSKKSTKSKSTKSKSTKKKK